MARARRNQDDDIDDGADDQDPALKHFNRGAFQAKHVVKETAMGGIIGALVGAAAAVALVVALPVIAAAGMPLGGLLALFGMTSGVLPAIMTPLIIGAATTGAAWGGGLGAVVKGALAAGGANEAADGEEERLITKAQQGENRRHRMETLQQKREAQKLALDRQTEALRGSNPNMALPRGGQEAGRESYT